MNTLAFQSAFAATNPKEFAKAAVPRSVAYQSKHLWAFMDDQSEINYERALRAAPMRHQIPNPVIVISGITGSGKTTLARHLAAAWGDPAPMFGHAMTAALMTRSLEVACHNELKCIIFDNIYQPQRLGSELLLLLASATTYTCQEPRSRRFRTVYQIPRIIITIPLGMSLPPDLDRRAREIRLSPSPATAA